METTNEFTDHKETWEMLDRNRNVVKTVTQDGWDEYATNPLADDIDLLYREGDGEGDWDFNETISDIFVGYFIYKRECELADSVNIAMRDV